MRDTIEPNYYEDPQGRFRLRLPSTWAVSVDDVGTVMIANTNHPKGMVKLSFLAMRPLAGVNRVEAWKPLRAFPHEIDSHGRGQTAKSWTVSHGLTMAMVTYVFNAALGHLERKAAEQILDTLEIAARPVPSAASLPNAGRWFTRLFGR